MLEGRGSGGVVFTLILCRSDRKINKLHNRDARTQLPICTAAKDVSISDFR